MLTPELDTVDTEHLRNAVQRRSTSATPARGEARARSLHVATLSRGEKRRRRRATAKYRSAHATRERVLVAFNVAFRELRELLPTIPPDKKLPKIEILPLAVCYIAYLNHVLDV